MRYWLDTEFMEDGKTIEPISIGIVAQDDREYYAEFIFDPDKASDWVYKNVIPHLKGGDVVKSRAVIRKEIFKFVNPNGFDPYLEFWAYFADYDWVLLCQLYGAMVKLPQEWPRFCMDVKQLLMMRGNPAIPEGPTKKHNALADAWWARRVWEELMKERDPHA